MLNAFKGFHIRFPRYLYPRLARLMLWLATYEVRRKLNQNNPLKVLVDNTILDIAVTHESKWVPVDGGGYLARVPVHSLGNATERYQQAIFLTGLTHLAKLGFVKFYTSAELQSEQYYQPTGRFRGYGWFDYSLFRGIPMESLDGWTIPTMGPRWMKLPSAKEQLQERIKSTSDPLFQKLYQLLSQQLGKKCDQDAWHIRTAEVHGCAYFLTTDRPLLKAWKSLGRKEPIKSLRVAVLSPTELAAELGLRAVPPMVLSYDNADCFVRVDTTMPREERRPGSKYRKP